MDDLLRQEIRFLTTRLGAIVREQCGSKTFDAIETLRRLARQIRDRPHSALIAAKERAAERLPVARAEEVAHAFSLFFHLVNLCEERQRIRRLAAHEAQEGGAPMSLRHTFAQLARHHVPPARVNALMRSMRVEPVLTAHPTEAKRRSVLNQILRLGRTMDDLSARGPLNSSSAAAIDPWIEALWLTDEMRERPVTPRVEIESTLVFMERTIYDLAGIFWERLEEEWQRFTPRQSAPPFLSFGSWVGGDREGNPYVTSRVSLDAVEHNRLSVLAYYRGQCERLLGLVPFACRSRSLAREVRDNLARDLERFPETKVLRNLDQPHELFRLKLRVMIWRLDRTLTRAPGAYSDAEEFVADASNLERWLITFRGPRVARLGPARLRVAAQVFGFHSLRLDFRQHAARVRAAADQLLSRAALPLSPEGARIQSIRRLLSGAAQAPLPVPPEGHARTASTARSDFATLDEFRALKEIQKQHGENAASRYILSMTSRASDVWNALLLGKHAGLVECGGGKNLRSSFDVVPLFETVNDLEAGPEILESLLSDPPYRRLLRSRGNFQEIMLGYSDSVKDSGYLAANFALFRAQKRLLEVAERHGVRLGFFHGKGGTIDRGGGQSYRSIQAQPEAAPGGRIRITEQGEVISLKYSSLAIAERNLEQLVSSVLDAHLLAHRDLSHGRVTEWESLVSGLAAHSREYYRDLVYGTPEFTRYFRQATPIDLIERLSLGSRPSRRSARGGQEAIPGLRAIPWVFAWTQSRHFLPSWYGIGHAFDRFASDHGGVEILREMYRDWPFFTVLIDNAEMSLAKTDLYIAGRYAALVRPRRSGAKIFARIEREYHRSVRFVLEICGAKELLGRQPVLRESIRLRNPYVDPLSFLQLRFLKEQRRARRPDPDILRVLQITVGGIAFGMKSTG